MQTYLKPRLKKYIGDVGAYMVRSKVDDFKKAEAAKREGNQ